jgi:hypothetical protein
MVYPTGMFYAVVYGDSWEDIDYFYSFHQARTKLVIQTRNVEHASFHPLLIAYNRDPCSGCYGRTREFYGIPVSKLPDLLALDDVMLKNNPEIAFKLIESIL